MTRHAYYHAQPRCGNGHTPQWRRDTVLAITALFCAEEGHFPSSKQLRTRWAMPSFDTIAALWGSMAAYRAAYLAAYPGPLPQPPRAPGAPRPGRVPTARQWIPCLRCTAQWPSPDPRCCRICPTCHARDDAEDGVWLAGVALRETHGESWWDLEEEEEG